MLNLPLTLEPGQEVALRVAFAPALLGQQDGAVSVRSNALGAAVTTVGLTALGRPSAGGQVLTFDPVYVSMVPGTALIGHSLPTKVITALGVPLNIVPGPAEVLRGPTTDNQNIVAAGVAIETRVGAAIVSRGAGAGAQTITAAGLAVELRAGAAIVARLGPQFISAQPVNVSIVAGAATIIGNKTIRANGVTVGITIGEAVIARSAAGVDAYLVNTVKPYITVAPMLVNTVKPFITTGVLLANTVKPTITWGSVDPPYAAEDYFAEDYAAAS